MCGSDGDKSSRGNDDDDRMIGSSDKKEEQVGLQKVEDEGHDEEEYSRATVSSDPSPPVKDQSTDPPQPQGSRISNGETLLQPVTLPSTVSGKQLDVQTDDQFGSQRSLSGEYGERSMVENQATTHQDPPPPPVIPPGRLRCINHPCIGWRATLLLGCGHLTYCTNCSDEILYRLSICPMPGCEARVKAFITVLYE